MSQTYLEKRKEEREKKTFTIWPASASESSSDERDEVHTERPTSKRSGRDESRSERHSRHRERSNSYDRHNRSSRSRYDSTSRAQDHSDDEHSSRRRRHSSRRHRHSIESASRSRSRERERPQSRVRTRSPSRSPSRSPPRQRLEQPLDTLAGREPVHVRNDINTIAATNTEASADSSKNSMPGKSKFNMCASHSPTDAS